jgi:hypothetical protein
MHGHLNVKFNATLVLQVRNKVIRRINYKLINIHQTIFNTLRQVTPFISQSSEKEDELLREKLE